LKKKRKGKKKKKERKKEKKETFFPFVTFFFFSAVELGFASINLATYRHIDTQKKRRRKKRI